MDFIKVTLKSELFGEYPMIIATKDITAIKPIDCADLSKGSVLHIKINNEKVVETIDQLWESLK